MSFFSSSNSNKRPSVVSFTQPQIAQQTGEISGLISSPTVLDNGQSGMLMAADFPYVWTLSPELAAKIVQWASDQAYTADMLFLTAFRVLLCRYHQPEDLRIQTAISHGTPGLVTGGIHSNTAHTLLIPLSGEHSAERLLSTVRQLVGDAYTQVNHPAKDGSRTVGEEITPEITSRFGFGWNSDSDSFRSGESLSNPGNATTALTPPELVLRITTDGGHFACALECHNRTWQLMAQPERMARHLERLLTGMMENAGQSVAFLPMLSPDEREQLLTGWNPPLLAHPPTCAHYLFEEQAARTPEAIALTFAEQQLTYAELNRRANQLAHYLQKSGVGPEAIVGVCMKRSPQFIISLLGILKAGGAFLPLDPGLPAERLGFMLEDAAPALIITQEGLSNLPDSAGHIPRICLGRDWPEISREPLTNPPPAVESHNLMYVVYTSGSSGKPKGVLVEHASLVSFLNAYDQVIRLNEQDRVLQFVPVVFDPVVEDIFCTFHRGARLVLRTEDMTDSAELFLQRCREWGITLLNLPAAYWHLLATELTRSDALPLPECIRVIKVGGERLLPEKVTAWQRRFGHFPRLMNAYGPTETTIAAAMYDCMHLPAGAPEVPIGFHLGNTRAYVVDPYFQPVPAGVPGELCLGGDALARGYLKRPDLQAHKFITPPLAGSADARWYRTGDSVRWLPDGALEYLGRIDDQVKIRGFRIEPGEIESVLSTHGAVKQAAVVVREDVPGEKTIVAYLVSEAGQTEPGQLRAYLREQLPEYMIPASFVFLEKLPLTFNGKVDRKALPAPERTARSVAAPEQPQAVSEVLLAELWTDVLNQPDIGVEDNFFDLGGNSLLAIKLIAEIKRSTGLDLPVVWVFANPTIRMQARQLHSAPKSDTSDILINIRPGNEEPPLYIIHDGHGGVEYGFRLAAFMKAGRHVYGIQVSDLSQVENRLRKVEVIAEYYVQRLLKHQPEGPFHLGGFSGGAAVTFEMARQLKALGKEVGMVAIFDAFPVRLNRFTYQRIGLLYVLRSVLNLFFSSGIGARQKWNLISTEVPKIIHQNWMRIKLKQAERESDTVDNPGLKIFRIMRVAIDSYQFKPYAGPLVFVRALENPARYLRNSHFGWGHYAKPVRVYDLPGNHYQLFARPDNLRAIAGIVETHLAESEAARPGGLKYPSVAVNDPA